jgi:hypothetical protein
MQGLFLASGLAVSLLGTALLRGRSATENSAPVEPQAAPGLVALEPVPTAIPYRPSASGSVNAPAPAPQAAPAIVPTAIAPAILSLPPMAPVTSSQSSGG